MSQTINALLMLIKLKGEMMLILIQWVTILQTANWEKKI